MKFCPQCAGPITHHIPPGDDKLRYCCLPCDKVYYQNPNNVVGTLPVWQDQVLLCRRAIEPRKGYWTLPAGFLENGETTLEGAIRETHEEAGARLQLPSDSLYALFNLPVINQVYVFFRADLASLDFDPGEESLEVKLFREHEVPWDNIAFAVVRKTLELYFEDRRKQHYPVRMFDVRYSPERKADIQLISQS
ncbi:NUDIX hydrolase [Pseudohongiella sp. SYSU M77423]|uniref:NUDIX hydrolase n=1 Tax=Pseudohongiella sp. SYSU M77423 TaxID=3042312 RepID=UPI000C91559B|nr:NUDIX hydrolase [Pseudohongiella sp. SYSU M77423]MAY54490.1 NUDIX hydrolase [Gammaproteobacteria bacterium]MDH7943510.1 NUDIX hydrolase [Pseudohongiella sp. SYSU M77423]HBX37796.1 NUDIX hydrolase [Pseudohongiella sp.]|tara:strand:- start:1936 stop:2514 length:579 start_codon:yes stop_codon:yes gene_type:complete